MEKDTPIKLNQYFILFILLINIGCLDTDKQPSADTFSDTGARSDTYNSDNKEDALPSCGCGLSPITDGEKEISVEDKTRTYILNIPDDYDTNTPYPIIFVFHGMGMDAKSIKQYSGLSEYIGDEAIIVYPQAIGDLSAWEISNDQDLLFFDAMLDKLSDQLCIDQARVFATGHSNGASFSNTLGCYRGDVLRAIAPVSGRNSDYIEEEMCEGQVAVWVAHGENDIIVPFNRGEQAKNFWTAENSCNDSHISIYPNSCIEYTGCDEEYPVQWCAHSAGHRWPDFAAEAISDFFRSF